MMLVRVTIAPSRLTIWASGRRVEALNLVAEFVADVALKDLGSVGVAVGVLGLQGRADDVGDSHRHG
jgi:hypothetical protein